VETAAETAEPSSDGLYAPMNDMTT
jgi:hypothetical protein